MPSLTSCYFCGDAVGASLDEYDLPEDASPDEQVTVTLCAGCKGKLTELLEEIGPLRDAADSVTGESPAAPTADADPGGAVEPAIDEDPDLDPVAGDQEPIFADDGDAVLGEELPADTEEAKRPFEESETTAAERSATSDANVDPASSENRTTEAGSSDDDAPVGGSPTDGSDGVADTPNATNETESDGSDDSGTGSDEGSGDSDRDAPPVETDAGGSRSVSKDAAGASTGSSADGPLADVSPRTYNRVVRLLQNREFPVDRADFEALATSAYELDHGECTAALDGAIEKGLLEERDGELYRPE